MVVISAVLLLIFINKMVYEKNKKRVYAESTKLRELMKLNSSTKFHTNIPDQVKLFDSVNTKSKIDNYKLNDAVFETFISEIDKFRTIIENSEDNNENYRGYEKTFKRIYNTKTQFSENKLIEIENSLLNQNKKSRPVTHPTLKFTVRYTTPAGQRTYEKYLEYSYQDIVDEFDDALSEIEYRESKEHFKKLQRKKVTTSMRFEVFKRDDYRCQICGASSSKDQNVTLHLDHIIPVSKGGETVVSNLQTLCSHCNLGKSDKDMY